MGRWMRVAACVSLGAGLACGVVGAQAGQGAGVEGGQGATYVDPVSRSELRERAIVMLEELARSGSALTRANAMEALQSVPSRAEDSIRAGLADENQGVRFAAAMTAGRARMRGLVEAVRPLLRDPSPSVRAAAIFAMRVNGQNVDPTPLASMLESRDAGLRGNVVMVLGEMGDASAAPMLKGAANDPRATGSLVEQKIVRLQIAEALVKLGDAEAVQTVRAALYPSSASEVETAVLAAQILGNVKDSPSAPELIGRVREKLRPVEDPSAPDRADPKNPYLWPPELRLAAARSLGQIGRREGVYVADQYARAEEPMVRALAALVYGETGREGDLSKLEAMLGDGSEGVRLAAAAGVVRVVDRLAGSRGGR
ncbi:MAG: HEAT repeat domain-containing protein [Phycisphaerales bacterium]